MKRIILTVFTLLPAFSIQLNAQDLTGIWRGYFITDNGLQYRFEVQIIQSGKNTLSGVTYSYQDKSFYGKSTMTGNFTSASGNALIQEIKTIEVKMQTGHMTCIQKCLLNYARSGREEFLEGIFSSIVEKTDTLYGSVRGDDCGGGKMFLRKVPTSDFYVEPFLRNRNPDIKNPPLVKNNTNTTTQKSTPKTSTTPPKQVPANDRNSTALVKPMNDSVSKIQVETNKKEDETNLTLKPTVKIPSILKTRENSLVQTLIVNNGNITVRIYDNGEIDDDTISVYLDNELVLSKKRLTASPLSLNIKMDESNDEHELVMVAENLGRIPPNTSLMIVTAGDQRFEVRITSTEQKNALVKFKYVKRAGPLPLP